MESVYELAPFGLLRTYLVHVGLEGGGFLVRHLGLLMVVDFGQGQVGYEFIFRVFRV